MWVYRTRAALEHSIQERANAAATHAASGSDESSSPLSPDSQSTLSGETPIKEEPNTPSQIIDSKWFKRKRAFNLKLEGISITRAMPTVNGGGITKNKYSKGKKDSGVHMLELFENMMKTRMESCERVTRMVRNASASRKVSPQHTPGFSGGMQVR
ncbi:hypothetical protein BJ138DRAFT_1140351 [Hygrophoropsis aurantiaca]|uniref:Uncharacterized protein n=1 Tax=Hygrophoropsis aurantiaca TaxID=72124 RepID=A0ACB8AT15_9AGAM|nr:hypothetical protein BJ138DRAFT_1140351 [Hygrophoropsis aurantiaca]